jgi:hypothetical protein
LLANDITVHKIAFHELVMGEQIVRFIINNKAMNEHAGTTIRRHHQYCEGKTDAVSGMGKGQKGHVPVGVHAPETRRRLFVKVI